MYLSVNVEHGRDDQLILAHQLGVESVMVMLMGDEGDLFGAARHRVERTTLQLAGLELAGSVSVETMAAAGKAGVALVCIEGPVHDTALISAAEAAGVTLAARTSNPAALADGIRADWVPWPGDRSEGAQTEGAAAAPNLAAVRLEGALAGAGVPRLLADLASVGFQGPVRAATPPEMSGDEGWRHKGRGYDLGYLRAVMQVVDKVRGA